MLMESLPPKVYFKPSARDVQVLKAGTLATELIYDELSKRY
jgi:hypothetical protein